MLKLLSVAAAALLIGGHALAATQYSDRSAFNATGAGVSFFTDFEGYGESANLPFGFGPISFSGITNAAARYYAGDDPTTSVGNVGNVNGSSFVQVKLSNYHPGFIDVVSGPLTLESAEPIQALGFDLRAYFDTWGSSNGGETVLFWTDTGESGRFTLPSTNSIGFLGLVFDAPVQQINFRLPATRNGHTWFGIDNLQTFSAVTAVPEPSSLALLMGGLALLGAGARRHRKP